MADESGILDLGSLAHVERRDLADYNPAPVDEPLCGFHDKEADARATAVYFRENVRETADPVTVESVEDMNPHSRAEWYEPKVLHQAKDRATLIDLAAEKQKRCDVVRDLGLAEAYWTTEAMSDRLNRFATKDSGTREEFPTGSRRDTREGKGRYDLLPPYAIQRLAQVYERGAAKYDDRNWEKGQPLTRFLDSALRHTFQVLEGKTDEDHAMQACWNLVAFVEIQHRINEGILPEELNDL